MILLCKNRFEGFGPHSDIHPSTPTHCFNDVVLVPLATWSYLAILLTLFLLNPTRTEFFRRQRAKGEAKQHRRILSLRSLYVGLYYLLIIGMLGLTSVEIARLVIADLGIGLLPFNYIGILLALLVHLANPRTSSDGSTGRPGWATAVFWMVMAIVTGFAAKAAKMEENMGYKRSGRQELYPIDDVFVDNLTMACVGVVLAGLEILIS